MSCKAQSDSLLLHKTSREVPLHNLLMLMSLMLQLICMLWCLCQGTLLGKSQLVHFESLCAKVKKASSVFKIISYFWWGLVDSMGCIKKLESLKGFHRVILFKKIFFMLEVILTAFQTLNERVFLSQNSYFLKKVIDGTQWDL